MFDILIRPARLEDRESLTSWTKDTFEWGDYISEVFDDWTNDTQGRFIVADLHGRIIGCSHVALLGRGEAWNEGMRVHPEFRRLGISMRLDLALRDYARANGCQIARLATEETNAASQKTLAAEDYKELFHIGFWKMTIGDNAAVAANVPTATDVPDLFEDWIRSETRKCLQGLIAIGHWRWAELTETRLATMVDAGVIRSSRHGFWRVEYEESSRHYIADNVVWRACGDSQLASDILADARAMDATEIELAAHENSALASQVRELRFEPSGGLYIYECNLMDN